MSKRQKRDDWDEDSSNPGRHESRRIPTPHRVPKPSFFARIGGWVRGLLGMPQRPLLPAPPRPWDEHSSLPKSVSEKLAALPADLPGEVSQIVADAIEDYLHLEELVSASALCDAPIEDAVLLEEAALSLSELAVRAKSTATVVSLADRRSDDAQAQEARGLALARLTETGTVIHDAASAAILYSATLSEDDASSLKLQADELHLLVEAQGELDKHLE